MEEDIKILEEFIEAYRIAEEVLDGEVIQAIENLIARNKYYEKLLTNNLVNENFKELYLKLTKVVKEELEKNKDVFILNNYIPKSKVKEKIEEAERNKGIMMKRLYTEQELLNEVILNLRKLLD